MTIIKPNFSFKNLNFIKKYFSKLQKQFQYFLKNYPNKKSNQSHFSNILYNFLETYYYILLNNLRRSSIFNNVDDLNRMI